MAPSSCRTHDRRKRDDPAAISSVQGSGKAIVKCANGGFEIAVHHADDDVDFI